MSMIKAKDTTPEIALRKLLYAHGVRGYRTHYNLPGKPDIVFPKKKVAVFVDGCFWHKCPRCFIKPKTNISFWTDKIASNIRRDTIVNTELGQKGWKVVRIWEHEVRRDLNRCYLKIYKELTKRAAYK